MRKVINLYLLLLTTFVAISCNENNDLIGSTLDPSEVNIHSDLPLQYTQGTDSIYSVLVNKAVNRAQYHMLGDVKIPEFGEVSSDYLTELRYIAAFDTNLVKTGMMDSIALTIKFLVDHTTGDDRAPIQVAVYQLNKSLTAVTNDTVFTNTDPLEFYDTNDLLAEKVFTSTPSNVTADTVTVILPMKRNGLTTKEWAEEFFKMYKDFKYYPTDKELSKYLPGLYITHNYGGGAIIRIHSTTVDIYHRTYLYDYYGEIGEVDGVKKEMKKVTPIFVSTNEVESVNHMSVNWSQKVKTIADSRPIITTPLGYNLRIKLPINEIIEKFKKETNRPNVMGVINSFVLTVPVYYTENNIYDITPPPYLMLMRAGGNQIMDGEPQPINPDIFFYKKMLPDKKNVFVAAYNSAERTYDFGNIQGYITNILKYDPNNGEQDNYKLDSEMILVPVGITTTTDGTITAIYPYLQAPKYAEIDTENIKMKFVYSTKDY